MTTATSQQRSKSMKTYAYVNTETCQRRDAVRPGSYIGRDEIPVAKHGDYTTWCCGKRETLAMCENYLLTPYRRSCARAVATLMGWL